MNADKSGFFAGALTANGNFVIGRRGGAVSCGLAAKPNFPGKIFDSAEAAAAALPAWLERQKARRAGPEFLTGEHSTFVVGCDEIVY